jgi:hypothetical protein
MANTFQIQEDWCRYLGLTMGDSNMALPLGDPQAEVPVNFVRIHTLAGSPFLLAGYPKGMSNCQKHIGLNGAGL